MRAWRYLDSGPATGARNMAIDECLLAETAAGRRGRPTLRFYGWLPPAVSLGRFQDEATAVNRDACRRLGIDIVRRITGGRAVLHHRELTYSVVSPLPNGQFPNDVLGTYKVIAKGLLVGLANLGIPAELVSRGSRHASLVERKSKDAACFSSPSWYELLAGGRKIVGSAQRRVAGAFLQHGSILIEYDPALESAVIPGGGRADAVTSIRQVSGRDIGVGEVKEAIFDGFRTALCIELEPEHL
jgi:lipoate-protein ligase A